MHIAPAFGADDLTVGREHDLPVINAVTSEGLFEERVIPWAGRFVKQVDMEIVDELRERGLLLAYMPYEHSYPHCWRCDTPLIYYAKASWYIRTTAIKDELLAANESVTWHPGPSSTAALATGWRTTSTGLFPGALLGHAVAGLALRKRSRELRWQSRGTALSGYDRSRR